MRWTWRLVREGVKRTKTKMRQKDPKHEGWYRKNDGLGENFGEKMVKDEEIVKNWRMSERVEEDRCRYGIMMDGEGGWVEEEKWNKI